MRRTPTRPHRRTATVARRRPSSFYKYCFTFLAIAVPVAVIVALVLAKYTPTLEKAQTLLQSGDRDGGVAMLTKLATKHNLTAQRQLADMYLNGKIVPRDTEKGVWFLEMAAYDGDVDAQMRLVDIFAGDSDPQSKFRMLPVLQMAADTGNVAALSRLGKLRYLGDSSQVDYELAQKYLNKAAAAGDPAAIGLLGRMHLYGHGVPADREEAETKLREAAAGDDPLAATILGTLHLEAAKTDADYAEAAKFFRIAADQKDPEGMAALGELYYKGQGVTKSARKARELLAPAAEAGSASAQYMLARLNLDAEEGRDASAAVGLLRRSADQKYLPSLILLSDLYLSGDGTKKDPVEAEKLLQLAAATDNAEAQRKLGLLYLYGDGTRFDREEAMRYLTNAAKNGDDEAGAIIAGQQARATSF